jgi:3-isopropylmalate dehydrogenase
MLARFSLGQEEAATRIERAVEAALADGPRTADLAASGTQPAGTSAFADAVIARLGAHAAV